MKDKKIPPIWILNQQTMYALAVVVAVSML